MNKKNVEDTSRPWVVIEALGRGAYYIGPEAGMKEYKSNRYPKEACPPKHDFMSEVATVKMGKWSKENALMMAAAPDLLAEQRIDLVDTIAALMAAGADVDNNPVVIRKRALIAKATEGPIY